MLTSHVGTTYRTYATCVRVHVHPRLVDPACSRRAACCVGTNDYLPRQQKIAVRGKEASYPYLLRVVELLHLSRPRPRKYPRGVNFFLTEIWFLAHEDGEKSLYLDVVRIYLFSLRFFISPWCALVLKIP